MNSLAGLMLDPGVSSSHTATNPRGPDLCITPESTSMSAGTLLDDNSSQSTSTNLLKRVVEGDQEAWARFVTIYGAFIYARCRRCGVLPQDAADLVQNVLKRVHKSISELRRDKPGQGLRPWLRTITRNVINDHFRSVQQDRDAFGNSPFPQILDQLAASQDDDHSRDSAGSPELVLLIRSAVETIRIDYEVKTWDAFWRTAVELQPTADVALDLGIAQGTVRQARYKILKRLREELQGLL
jgi:RNA polymerase sigma-70 factor (ECF subfamily)